MEQFQRSLCLAGPTIFLSVPAEYRQGDKYVLGCKLGGYIGEGSYGKVRVASDSQGRQWAVKVYKKYHLRSIKICYYEDGVPVFGNALQALERELDIYRTLDHQLICRCLAVLELQEEEQILLFLQNCQLGTLMLEKGDGFVYNLMLEKELQNKGYKDRFAKTRIVVESLLQALLYLRSKGIGHRDLKPTNVGFTGDCVLKLFDFGTACKTEPDSPLVMDCVGTPGFRGPEAQFSDQGYLPEKNDVFGLGMTAYVYVTGKMPFRGETPAQVDSQARHTQLLIPQEWPDWLKALLGRATAKEPQERALLSQLLGLLN